MLLNPDSRSATSLSSPDVLLSLETVLENGNIVKSGSIFPACMTTVLSVRVFCAWLFHVNAGAVPEAGGVSHWNKALVLSFQVWPCF